jgi:hypothetical protein
MNIDKEALQKILANLSEEELASMLIGTTAEEAPKKSGRARKIESGQKTSKTTRGGKSKSGKKPAMSQTVDTSGARQINEKISHILKTDAKTDSSVDKQLCPNYTQRPRRQEAEYVEIKCGKCNSLWEVPESFIYNDDEGSNFTCEECIGK